MVTSLDMAVIDIEKAIKGNMYYIALISTLSLIDLCSALETEDGKTDRHVFIAWYDRHLAPRYTWLSGQDCYGIRCGMLHQGVMDHGVRNMPKSSWKRIGFILPDGNGNQFRQIASDDHYFTGLAEFCLDVIANIRAWFESAKDDPNVKKNLGKLVRLHVNGIHPNVVGIPILG